LYFESSLLSPNKNELKENFHLFLVVTFVNGSSDSARKETIRINWGAYPQYHAPEIFAPFILDGRHLYYVNAFENAASTMETSAVAAENIARLILSRYFGKVSVHSSNLNLKATSQEDAHLDL
jgi:prenylcysteine oxidase/farnesylcysteine lyase